MHGLEVGCDVVIQFASLQCRLAGRSPARLARSRLACAKVTGSICHFSGYAPQRSTSDKKCFDMHVCGFVSIETQCLSPDATERPDTDDQVSLSATPVNRHDGSKGFVHAEAPAANGLRLKRSVHVSRRLQKRERTHTGGMRHRMR